MRTISTLFAIALAACNINIFNGGDDDSRTSHRDAGAAGSGDGFDGGGVYGADAGIYNDLDAGCGGPSFDAGYYEPDAGCPNGFGSGGSGSTCIE
ncbi:MAG TPA: hypothetical protein VGG28_09870 [Kofleriaceae bacterium]|jgi:hypothetical protein